MKKLIATTLLPTLCSLAVMAQSVTGVVTDKSGQPVIGVTVIVKGKTTGTSTLAKGNYSISPVNLDRDSLQFSFIGLKTTTVPVNKRTTVNVVMQSDAVMMDEVVSIGYATQRRRDLTGAVSSISAEDIMKMPTNSLAEALTGKLAGVQVVTADGAPDAEVNILIRGRNSITQSSAPLYIVDGFPVNSISDIAQSDIATVDVLKDASSTAIYGSRGANGVIIITTKSAKEGNISVSLNAFYGLKSIVKTPEVLEPYEYALWQYELMSKRGASYPQSYYEPYFGSFADMGLYKNYAGNNWKKIVYGNTAGTYNYNLAISGKTDKMSYSASYSNQKDEAIMITSGFRRDNLMFKLQHKPSKKIIVDLQARYSSTRVSGSGANDQGGRSNAVDSKTRSVMQYSPIPLRNMTADGALDDEEMYVNSALFTPTVLIRDNDREQFRRNFTFSGGLTWLLSKSITFRTNINTDFNYLEDKRFFGVTTYYSRMNSTVKGLPANQMVNTQNKRLANSNTLNIDFRNMFGKGSKSALQILLGQETNILESKTLTSDVDGFPESFTAQESFKLTTSGSAIRTNNFIAAPDKLISFFTRANYSYDKGRYMLTATFRADGSSKFQGNNRWGYFPSGAFAWRASDTKLLKNVNWLTNLKARVSIGLAGNNNIPSGQTIAELLSQTTPNLPFGSTTQYLYLGDYLINPHLKWETTTSRNAGVDFGLFNNRLSGNVDVYWNTTNDLLIRFPIKGAGYNEQFRNLGSTENKGVEIVLNGAVVNKKNFTLNLTANISMNKNKVLSLGGLQQIQAYSSWASTQIDYDFVVEVGKPLGMIWGYLSDGRYPASDFTYSNKWLPNPDVVDNSGLLGPGWGPGGMRLKDLNGDKIIGADKDRTYLGSTMPKATGGFSLSGQLYNFDFNANFNYTLGNKVYNAGRAEWTQTAGYNYQNILNIMNSGSRWNSIDKQGNLVTDPAQLDEMNRNTTMWSPVTARRFVSDFIVEDGSFLRLSSATIGYTIPEKILRKIRMKSIRVYVTGTNLWLLTGYSGYDPEADTRRSTPLTPGVDYSPYPRSKGVIFGANINF